MRSRIRAHFSNLATLYERLALLLSDRKINVENVTVTAAEKHGGAVAVIEADADRCGSELARIRSGYFEGAAVEEERPAAAEKELAVIRIAARPLWLYERKAPDETLRLSLRDDGSGGTLITAEGRPDRIDVLIEKLFQYGIRSMSRTRIDGEENGERRSGPFALAGGGNGAAGGSPAGG